MLNWARDFKLEVNGGPEFTKFLNDMSERPSVIAALKEESGSD
jgi:hypothetical protein